MALVMVIVFLGVFAVAAVVMLAVGKNSSGQTKKVLAALDSAIAPEGRKAAEKAVNFRKSELLSAVPWLNKSLLKVDLAEYLHRLLNQADLKWTAGKLLLLCLASFSGTFYLIHLRTKSLVFALLCGFGVGFAPLGFVMLKRSQRFGKFEKALPDALDMMVSALRVGHSFSAALSLVTRECPDPLAKPSVVGAISAVDWARGSVALNSVTGGPSLAVLGAVSRCNNSVTSASLLR